jgi:hypothetical protein
MPGKFDIAGVPQVERPARLLKASEGFLWIDFSPFGSEVMCGLLQIVIVK